MNVIGFTTRTALKAARLPVDLAFGVLGRRPGRAQATVDRIDADIRETVGSVVGDRGLQEDARAGRAAADERERAAALREAAQERAAEGEQHRERVEQTADRQREEAKRVAGERKQEVRDDVSEQRRRRKDEEQRARLEQLAREEAAVEERQDALDADDEAARLKAAASRAKQERKARG